MAQITNTPVCKKTRSSVRQKHKMENDGFESIVEDAAVIAAPKTPTPAKRIMSETPRRSARKSVRPPLDYEDIIEKNTMSSATKEKKDTTLSTSTVAGEEGCKWVAADVGRHSGKRHRSRSRKTSKKPKVENKIEDGGEENKEQLKEEEQQQEEQQSGEQHLETTKIEEGGEENKKQLKEEEQQQKEQQTGEQHLETKKLEEEHQLQDPIEPENVDANLTKTATNDEIYNKNISIINATIELEAGEDVEDTNSAKLNLTVDINPDQEAEKENVETNVVVEATDSNPAAADSIVESETELVLESVHDPTSQLETLPFLEATKVNFTEMDELGLCPLEPEEQLKEDDNHDDEMLSLIVLDEDEPEDTVLNRTFDADEQSVVDMVEQAEDEKESKHQPKDKGYRFPTPLKSKSKPIFTFNHQLPTIIGSAKKTTTPLTPINNSLQVATHHPRKRSKSISDTKSKTVSFYSPIEVTLVNDIDKRWDTLNVTSNVTQRRKRSKSLDENRPFKSRIPKPKQYPPADAAVVRAATPANKLKMRTKLPDFAAIHQKQFGKMESLVDHMERKALRAKQLTSSALKLQQQQQQSFGSTTKKLPTKIEESSSRPRAQRKIEMSSELERQKRLPTPRKIVDVVMPSKPKINVPTTHHLATATTTTTTSKRPAFNLSSSIAPAPKILFSSETSTLSKTPAESVAQNNKVEARRQRHMEMFKGGRGNTKDKRSQLIRGVRSNRRFELQMQHRRQMDG